MNNSAAPNKSMQSLVYDFISRFKIRSMTIAKGMGIGDSKEISDICIFFIKQQENNNLDYCVQFKLQNECADINQYIKAIHTVPEFSIELTQQCRQLNTGRVNDRLQAFIRIIRERVKSAQKEQEVQDINFVGNTFILNNATKFKVLSDEGDGRLHIEVLTRDFPLDAKLNASGLLDGLYLGSIKLVDSDGV